MKKLSDARDTEIRNRLDQIGHNLYHDVVIFEDMCWAHKTIKELLYNIYELQEGMRNIGDEAG